MSASAIGVDAGSTTWKAVAIEPTGVIVGKHLERAHPLIQQQTERALAEFREELGIPANVPVGATGYGRKRIEAVRQLTEITCHARGAYSRTRKAGVLVDVGGQDSKVIRIGKNGDVTDFSMNDKCAAGTGRFLEVMLDRLQVRWEDIEMLVAKAQKPVSVSSTCTVFAESEVVSLLAEGESVEGILQGLHQSLASRLAGLIGPLRDDAPVFMSGGVSLNGAMVDALGAAINRTVIVLPDPQYIGALGAALSVI